MIEREPIMPIESARFDPTNMRRSATSGEMSQREYSKSLSLESFFLLHTQEKQKLRRIDSVKINMDVNIVRG
jgi:hypothetical protein